MLNWTIHIYSTMCAANRLIPSFMSYWWSNFIFILKVLSNGKYKSVIHRAVVNNKATRISVAVANGPELETVVTPAPEFLQSNSPAYVGIKYKDFIQLQQSNQLDNKSCLDRVRIWPSWLELVSPTAPSYVLNLYESADYPNACAKNSLFLSSFFWNV